MCLSSGRNGRVHLNQRGRQFSLLLAAEGCTSTFIVGSNAGYTMLRGSVKGSGYPFHSPVSPSLPLPCVTVSHFSRSLTSEQTRIFSIAVVRISHFFTVCSANGFQQETFR